MSTGFNKDRVWQYSDFMISRSVRQANMMMRMSKVAPKDEGYYYMAESMSGDPQIVEVEIFRGELVVLGDKGYFKPISHTDCYWAKVEPLASDCQFEDRL